jgi:branched-chain amino acid transport system permease protein
MKVINFAQGECLMLGMYAAWALHRATGLSPYILIVPVMTVMFLIGQFIFSLVINPIVGRPPTDFVVVTMGLAFVLVSVIQLIFSPTYQTVVTTAKNITIRLGSVSLGTPRVIACGVMIAAVLAVRLFLKKTDVGRAMRATAENLEVAQMLGVNTRRNFALAFALGVTMAGLSGLLLTPIYYVFPNVGMPFKTISMVIVVLGGLGSIGGAVLGGLIAGVVEAVLGAYISPDLAPAGIFLILILVLAFRPEGMFGKGARKA